MDFGALLRAIADDLALASRAVATRRMLTAVIVSVMAVGVAAHTAVFTVTKAIVLNPLPYAHPDRLVTVTIAGRDPSLAAIDAATVHDWTARSRTFERFALWNDAAARIAFGDRVEMIRGMRVSASYFDVLGVRMLLGRNFLPEEDTPADRNAAILTFRVWQEQFGGDPLIVGRSVPGVDTRYRIVGVLPPEFRPLHMSNPGEFPRIFLPTGFGAGAIVCRTCSQARVIGVLRPDASVPQARAELAAIGSSIVREHPDDPISSAVVQVAGLRDDLVGRFGLALTVCEAAASLFLLLACVNVASLLLVDASRRQLELAMRSALGAPRERVVLQLLAEGLLRAAAGGMAGIAVAWLAVRAIANAGATEIPRLNEVSPNRFTLLSGIVAIAATGVAFGLVPALRLSRVDINAALKGSETSRDRPGRRAAMRILLAGEVALAFVLVLAVALLGRSYVRLTRVDPGFDPSNVLTVSLLPDGPGYGSPQRHLAYFDAVVDRVRRAPGIDQVAYASTLPLSHPDARHLYIREHGVTRDEEAPLVDSYLVSPAYFDAMRIPLRRGRAFSDRDTASAAPVAIVSEACARTLFTNEDPIGRHVRVGDRAGASWATVVGIAGDVRQYGLDSPVAPAAYLPFAQSPVQGWSSLIVRSVDGAAATERTVRMAMADVDRTQPVFHLQPMDEFVSKSIAQRTFTLALVSAFGVLALGLAAFGVFGVVTHHVDTRQRELAIRAALGANGRAIAAMLCRDLAAIIAAGIVSGLIVFAAVARLLASLLFETAAMDPAVIAATMAVLVAAGLAAAGQPLLRAARTDAAARLRST